MLYILFSETEKNLLFYQCCCNRGSKPSYKMPLAEFYQLKEQKKLSKKLAEIDKLETFHCCNYGKPWCFKNISNMITVAVSKACNLNCPFCYVKSGHNESLLRKQIYFDLLEAVRNTFPDHELRLTDFGEPFFYTKEIVNYLLSLTKKDFKQVYVISNGTLLTPGILNTLRNNLKIPLKVVLDLDSMNPDMIKRLRKNTNLNTILTTILNLNVMQNNKLIFERINTVYYDKNEVGPVLDFIKDLHTASDPYITRVWSYDDKIYTED